MNRIISLATIFFSSCYITSRPMGIVYLRYLKGDSIKIEIPVITTGRGNLHSMALDFKKWKDTSSQWIYISRFENNISPDSATLYDQGGYGRRSIKGDIIFTGDSVLLINIKTPWYNGKGEFKRWSNYNYNGLYRIQSDSKPIILKFGRMKNNHPAGHTIAPHESR
jgi:hypothetical protein